MARKPILIALILLLLPISISDAAALSEGQSCGRINSKQIYKGTVFTCTKISGRLKWIANKGSNPAPSVSPSENSYSSIPEDNLVVKNIQSKISSLRKPDLTMGSDITINTQVAVEKDALDSVLLQHKYMTQAFPEVFKSIRNDFYIFETVDWALQKAKDLNCWIPPQLSRPNEIPPTMWSITTNCSTDNSKITQVSFLNWPSFKKYDPAPKREVSGKDMWAYQAGQEGDGGGIQAYYYAGRAKYGLSNPLPAWFEQGGQFALSSIALAVQTRKWRQSSLMQGRVSTCNGKKVEDSVFYNANPNLGGCHYELGAIATELMVALYGFEAPITWYKNIEISPKATQSEYLETWDKTFKLSYGVTLSKFYDWANAYSLYLATNGSAKLPSDLLNALKR